MDEVENFFFANFQILGPLGCQGWVDIPQNVKKSKSPHPTVYSLTSSPTMSAGSGVTGSRSGGA
jgi:hypothetical protein